MADIELVMNNMEGFDKTFKRDCDIIDDVLNKVKKTKNKLNNQVEAKQLIDTRFDKLQTSLKKEKVFYQNMGQICTRAYEEFKEIDTQQANVFRGTESGTSVKSSIKDLLNGNYAKKYGSMSGYLMAGSSALIITNLSSWNTKMCSMNKNIQATNTAIQKETQTITKETNKSFVAFDNKKFSSVCKNKNGYSNYTILSGVKTEYIYCQKNYSKKGFASKGCVSTADAIAQSIGDQKKYNPTSTWNGTQTSSYRTKKISGSDQYTEAQILSETYKQLQKGNPTVIRVESKSASGHSVVAVGLRNGADPNKLTDADILIIDPQDGKIKTLAERDKAVGNSAIKAKSGYSIRIPS